MWVVQKEILSLLGLAVALGPISWFWLKSNKEIEQMKLLHQLLHPDEPPFELPPDYNSSWWTAAIFIMITSLLVAALIYPR